MDFAKIWQADMEGNGLLPLIKGGSDTQKDPQKGYVIVDMNPLSGEKAGAGSGKNQITVFNEVVIPDGKRYTYDLFRKLKNNYESVSGGRDAVTAAEHEQIHEFLAYAAVSAPLRQARKYAEDHHQIKAGCSKEEWVETLRSIWFQPSADGTSFFEHVFIGEQGSKWGGHQFWYNYHLNEGPNESLQKEDSIVVIKGAEVGRTEKSNLAEVITIKYTLEATKNNGDKQTLSNDIGGLFVGISAEGLLALGTVAYLDGRARIPMELNGAAIDLIMHKTGDREKNPHSFYPQMKTPVHA
ncbi:hypothetical protein [Paenibacillus jilunlii]|uniref:Poly(U)-specific endoribonuclease n=1 Tax=Paenibacillus jilunlii TaxID=682956 RepID=A0A1G9REF9_9BACL|nr:hypothetical protein [Paenibacillus jilunlii]KWX76741.1 hypothetical protein AML91_09590 [Paenibacillus jilunlii]SDM21561.1 poly(U)-specific endoribonuclease [Paenibacillus jilunlii]